ncbi:MAG: hypothetical protein LUG64_06590, partial [Clostridiales bacterium]|nr:hypothetical protein [Clostridiales bacterium]
PGAGLQDRLRHQVLLRLERHQERENQQVSAAGFPQASHTTTHRQGLRPLPFFVPPPGKTEKTLVLLAFFLIRW